MKSPFTMSYVLGVTSLRLIAILNYSIKRTVRRIEEFADDRKKSEEILITILKLKDLKKQVELLQDEDFRNNYELQRDSKPFSNKKD